MASDRTKSTIRAALACLAACVVAALAACGGGSDSGDPGTGNPASKLTVSQAKAPLKGAAPELVSIRKQANKVLAQGGDAFQQRLDSLKAAGIPVVVNKWASWCGPCREEFPDFQSAAKKYGSKVAFLGINSNDGPDTASTFLSELPVPYPSYSDPDQTIANSLEIAREFPTTLFIDSAGEITYTQRGPFTSASELSDDITKYAQ